MMELKFQHDFGYIQRDVTMVKIACPIIAIITLRCKFEIIANTSRKIQIHGSFSIRCLKLTAIAMLENITMVENTTCVTVKMSTCKKKI